MTRGVDLSKQKRLDLYVFVWFCGRQGKIISNSLEVKTMKSFFGMAAAVLLVVSLLFVAAPDAAQAQAVSLSKMQTLKQNADAALIVVVKVKEKHKGNKHWKTLHHHAEQNAMVAAWYMELVQSGQEVFEEDADACGFVADDLLKAMSFFGAGRMDMVERLTIKIEIRINGMPIARAAAAVVIKVDFRGQTLDGRTIIIISERKRGGGVIVVNTGGNGGGNDNGNGGGGNNGGDNGGGGGGGDEECKETTKVEVSRECVKGESKVSYKITVKCKNRTYDKTVVLVVGRCGDCVIDADCDDHNSCTDDKCWDGRCWHSTTGNPSPSAPNQCQK
jgi:hypothetical protein